jgi:hypothetical protein
VRASTVLCAHRFLLPVFPPCSICQRASWISLPQVLIFCELLVTVCSFFVVQVWSRSGRCHLGFWHTWSLASPVMRARFDLESSVCLVPFFPLVPGRPPHRASAQARLSSWSWQVSKWPAPRREFVIFLPCFEFVIPAVVSTVTVDLNSEFIFFDRYLSRKNNSSASDLFPPLFIDFDFALLNCV